MWTDSPIPVEPEDLARTPEPCFVMYSTAPATLYYQCHTHQKLGWKIEVLDASAANSTTGAGDQSSHDLSSSLNPDRGIGLLYAHRRYVRDLTRFHLQPTRGSPARAAQSIRCVQHCHGMRLASYLKTSVQRMAGLLG